MMSIFERRPSKLQEDLYDSKRGTIFSDEFYSAQIKVLEERGWQSNPYRSFSRFWRDLKNKGGWWNPAYTFGEWGRVLTTRLHKYDFTKTPDRSHYVKSQFSSQTENYPYYLNVYESLSFSGGSGDDIPWLLENPIATVDTFWETWMEIHPAAAENLGISDGDPVIVESPLWKNRSGRQIFRGRSRGCVEHSIRSGAEILPSEYTICWNECREYCFSIARHVIRRSSIINDNGESV